MCARHQRIPNFPVVRIGEAKKECLPFVLTNWNPQGYQDHQLGYTEMSEETRDGNTQKSVVKIIMENNQMKLAKDILRTRQPTRKLSLGKFWSRAARRLH